MRLELRDIIHVPDAKKTFQFQLDLSEQDFYGSKPERRWGRCWRTGRSRCSWR